MFAVRVLSGTCSTSSASSAKWNHGCEEGASGFPKEGRCWRRVWDSAGFFVALCGDAYTICVLNMFYIYDIYTFIYLTYLARKQWILRARSLRHTLSREKFRNLTFCFASPVTFTSTHCDSVSKARCIDTSPLPCGSFWEVQPCRKLRQNTAGQVFESFQAPKKAATTEGAISMVRTKRVTLALKNTCITWRGVSFVGRRAFKGQC